MRLSVAMIAGGEAVDGLLEYGIRRSLRFAGEVVVVCDVEGKRADRTAWLAFLAGGTIVQHDWDGDFAAARNASIAACRGDWVLAVDADETVGDELLVWLACGAFDGEGQRSKVKGQRYDAYSFLMPHLVRRPGGPLGEHRADGWGGGRIARLFRRTPSLRYEGALHERPVGYGRLLETDLTMLHFGWARSEAVCRAKIEARNAQERALGQGGIHRLEDGPWGDCQPLPDGLLPRDWDERVLDAESRAAPGV
jgi:glycosyltransferase involved in cell wall biosynthesis